MNPNDFADANDFAVFVGNKIGVVRAQPKSISAAELLELSGLARAVFLRFLEELLRVSLSYRRDDGSPTFWAGFAWHSETSSYRLMICGGDYLTLMPVGYGEFFRMPIRQVEIFVESGFSLTEMMERVCTCHGGSGPFSLL